ncbi:MAG TPA: right-handed parallel beta-helix repeat-containing protein [Candidatus Baltobacteraceae bacterium]|nr:right-handed parallel beta-helix repeat-containing protein [Candidatus Baltobacteraceae bacterium]
MSDRKDYLTRAQLIGGMIATSALAACGRSTTPSSTQVRQLCAAASTSLVGAEKIFSDPVFKDLDKAALETTFDASAQIAALQNGYFSQIAQHVQTGKIIQSIPSGGIVIQSPGTYTFAGDIAWTPNDVQCSAITIQCSDVTLDLAGFTLTASISDKSQQITGIAVLGSDTNALANITITNGTVANLAEHGILATSVCGLVISRVTVTGVCMQNLATRLLTPAGIKVSKSENVTISGCSVTELNVTTDSCAGIFLLSTMQATVSGCRASGLLNNDGAVQGFSYIQCMTVLTTNCVADTLQSHFNGNVKTSGHTVLGFCPIFCWDLNYVDCSASMLTGCCDDCHGMSVFLDGNVTVSRFQADHVVDGVSPSNSGAKATGLEVYGVGVTLMDCAVSDIKAINPQDKQATGFSAWGLAIQFERCTASNVTVQDDFNNGSHAIGFGWAPDPRPYFAYIGAVDVTYTDCKADRCQVGFDTWYHVDSTWTRPVYTNCNVGILVEPGGKRTLSCDPCSECQPDISVTLTNFATGNTYPQSAVH